mgnify:CR=1 FL=1
MDNQAFRFLQNKTTLNSFLPQNVHGLQLDKYEHLKFKKGEIIFLPEQPSNKIISYWPNNTNSFPTQTFRRLSNLIKRRNI